MWATANSMGIYDEEPPDLSGTAGPKPQWGFRPDPDVQKFLEPAKKKGRGYFTRIVMRLLRIGRDVTEEMGQTYREIADYARKNGLTEGAAVAHFAVKGWECKDVDCGSAPKKLKK